MKLFFKKLGFFLGLVLILKLVIVTGLLFSLNNGNSNTYIGESTDQKKIVLVGASNIKYNFDFEYLSHSINEYSVMGVNLSEPSGLFAIINKLQKLKLTKEDVVVFCLPHSLYESEKFLPLRTHKKEGYSMAMINDALKTFPALTLKSLFFNTTVSDCYYNLSSIGDKHTDVKRPNFIIKPKEQLLKSYIDCIHMKEDKFYIKSNSFEKLYLEDIMDYVNNTIEAKVLYRFPAVMKNNYNVNMIRIDYLKSSLNFINNFNSAVYDKSYFYDQWYHLNSCGMEESSRKLLKELKSFIEIN
jgi:hypothetical protein